MPCESVGAVQEVPTSKGLEYSEFCLSLVEQNVAIQMPLVPTQGYLYQHRVTCTNTGSLVPTQGYLYQHRVTCTNTGLLVPTQGYLYQHRVTCSYP